MTWNWLGHVWKNVTKNGSKILNSIRVDLDDI